MQPTLGKREGSLETPTTMAETGNGVGSAVAGEGGDRSSSEERGPSFISTKTIICDSQG